MENRVGDKSLGNAQLLGDNEEGGWGGLTSASKSSQSPPHSDNPGCYLKDYRCIIDVCSFALFCLLSELNGIHVFFTHTYLQIINAYYVPIMVPSVQNTQMNKKGTTCPHNTRDLSFILTMWKCFSYLTMKYISF